MSNYSRRRFTPEEDQLIINQPTSNYSPAKLERMLRTGSDAMYRRAEELGVKLVRHMRDRSLPRLEANEAGISDNFDHFRIPDDDPYLARLRLVHGDRVKA